MKYKNNKFIVCLPLLLVFQFASPSSDTSLQKATLNQEKDPISRENSLGEVLPINNKFVDISDSDYLQQVSFNQNKKSFEMEHVIDMRESFKRRAAKYGAIYGMPLLARYLLNKNLSRSQASWLPSKKNILEGTFAIRTLFGKGSNKAAWLTGLAGLYGLNSLSRTHPTGGFNTKNM
jgi:hypothetical protein